MPAAKKKKGKGQPSWLTPPSLVWQARFGAGSFPFGQAARILDPLKNAGHSPETIAEHLEEYLGNTPPRYASLARFVITFAEWAPNAEPLVDDDGVLRE